MHRLRMRRVAITAAIAGLLGLAAILFGVINTGSHSAQATTPDGAWKLIGQITNIKKGPGSCANKTCHTVIKATIAPNAKTALLVKDAHIIMVSNPPDGLNDHPHSYKVLSYKPGTSNLTLERIGDLECTKPPAPGSLPAAGTVNIYTGPCVKPVVGTGNAADLSGISDIVVDGGNPAIDAYHCISRSDIDNGGVLKSSAVCFDNTGVLSAAGAEPINNPPGEGADGVAGLGPPPPPPYAVTPPAKGRGTYNAGTDTLTNTTCFPDVGSSVNIIAVLTIGPGTNPADPTLGAHAQLTKNGFTRGQVDIYASALGSSPQTNAACNALIPVPPAPAPTPGNIAIYPATDIAACGSDPGGQPAGDCVQSPYRLNGNVLHGYPDWDQDTCLDADELWEPKPNNTSKCGDDPWNPLDYVAGGDVSGTYDITAVAARQDVGAPGFYYYCDADINTSGKNLTARLLCYIDAAVFTVNPQAATPPDSKTCPPAAAQDCGDGISGAPPPGTTVGTYPTNKRLLADVDDKQTELTGVLDKTQNVIKLHGCFEDRDVKGALGAVYVDAIINAHTGHGLVKLWTQLSNGLTPANCVVGAPALGSPPPGMDTGGATQGSIVPLHIVRQAMKATPPAGRDSDTDGCPNKRELGDNQATGGLRDPSNHYDYMNPTKDGLNRVDDILAVVNQYFIDDPIGNPDMKSQTDRTAITGGNQWNLGPPNGQQRVDDILASVKQYFHDC